MKSNHLDPENLRIAQTDLCYNSSMRCPDCGGRKLRRRRNQRRRNPRRIIGPRGRGHWLRNPLKPQDYETRLNKLRKLGLSEEHLNQLSDFNTEYNDATQANYIIDWWLATIALQNDNKKYLSKYTNKYRITELEKELRMENYDALLHFARMAHSHSKFWVKWPSIPPSQLIESLKEQEAYKTFIVESRRKLPSVEGENARWKMERKEEILAKDLRDAKNKAKEKGFDTSWEAISDGRTSVKEKRAKFYRPEHHNVLLRFDGGYEWVLMHPDDRSKEAQSLDTCATPESGGVLVSLRKRKGDSDFYQSLAQFVIHFSKDAWKAIGMGDRRYTFLDAEKLLYLSANDPQFRGCGVIGEGRGTSNHKPLEKYHPYIIALLEQDWVNFVTLPDYIPGKSFALDDLSPSDKALLLEKKPWFGDPFIWLKEFGPANEKMTDYIMQSLRDPEDGAILLNSLKNQDLVSFLVEAGMDRKKVIYLLAQSIAKSLEPRQVAFRRSWGEGHPNQSQPVIDTKIIDDFWEAMEMPIRRGLSDPALAGLLILFSGDLKVSTDSRNQLNLVLDLLETQRPASAAKVIGDMNLITESSPQKDNAIRDDLKKSESISALLSLIADLLEKLIKEYPYTELLTAEHPEADPETWKLAEIPLGIEMIRGFQPGHGPTNLIWNRGVPGYLKAQQDAHRDDFLERSWSQDNALLVDPFSAARYQSGDWKEHFERARFNAQARVDRGLEDDAGMDLSKYRSASRVYFYYIPRILGILRDSQGFFREAGHLSGDQQSEKVRELLNIAIDLMLEVGIVDSEFRTILRNSFSFVYDLQY